MVKGKLLAIVGPTASGKTDVAIKVAKALDGEIVSADSMQIYRGMAIGSAQPTKAQMEEVPHHMVAFLEPDASYSVSRYQNDARKAIAEIQDRGKLPILCGGTGLYNNAVLYDFDFTSAKQDPEYRAKLQALYEKEGAEELHKMLMKVAPERAKTIHPNNVVRVIRSLEVHHICGETIEPMNQTKLYEPYYNTLILGINHDREVLYERINKRVDRMVEEGLLQEVQALLDRGCTLDNMAMKGLGYKEIIRYLLGETTLEEALYIIKRDTRHFAKRQLTWFRRDKNIHWIKAPRKCNANDIYTKLYEYIKNNSFI